MKNLVKIAALALLPFAVSAQSAEEQPIITLHSSAYTEVGESNQFSFLIGATEATYIDVDMGAGKNEVEISVANIDTSTGEWTGTWIPARATADGTIKIYGDASKIDVVVMDGAYITDIDLAACTNLEILSLEHNALKSLDLTPLSKLQAIYMSDNPFTAATPLIIGGPKNDLVILEVDIIDHLDPNFDLKLYPNLVTFDAYHTLGLKTIDPTGCPNLQSLSIEMTAVESIDVTKNPRLTSLNVSESRVRTLDLSGNPALVYLMAGHASGTINTDVKFSSIDLSHNPELFYLSLTGNNISSIDLSNNTKLQNLGLNRCQLTSVDLSKNTNLYSVDLATNNMTLTTLPLPQTTWGEYYYLQRPMQVERVYGVGSTLDLSDKVLRDGTTTTAKLMRKPFTGDAVELDAANYSYADGKVTFLKAVSDSVYVEFSNDVFNEYRQTTTMFRIKEASEVGKPTAILPLNIDGSKMQFTINVGVAGATEAAPKSFLIDFGNGTLQEFTTKSAAIDALSRISISAPSDYHGRPTIYMPEGNDLTAFAIDGVDVYSIDFKAATNLQQLSVTNAALYSVDLSYNRNLTYLDLSGNNLMELSLLGVYGDYEKNVLQTLKAANNSRLEKLELRDGSPIKVLDLSGNKFTELPMTEFDNATDINISNNLLTGELTLAYQLNAERINISGNAITSLLVDEFTALNYFNVSNTSLTFATMPLPASLPADCEYIYSPLNDLEIQAKAPAVNLTAQNLDGNTDFVWKKANGTVLTQGVDIDCNGGGTRFLDENLGAIYCEMTNPLFPGLTLKTTQVTVVGAPTNMIATFAASEQAAAGEIILRGSKASALYIDWRGDGTEYIEYPFNANEVLSYNFSIAKGATAKIYTYDSAEDLTVFSLYGVSMSSIDVSKLTALTALSIGGAGLTAEKMTLPAANLTELNLTGNQLSSFPFASKYPKLVVLNLSNNAFTSFDASVVPGVQCLYMANNQLSEIKFGNKYLWDLHLNGNAFESINLSGLDAVEQLFLNNNQLSSIDLAPVGKTLAALSLVGNKFTFATLPDPAVAPKMTVMLYGLQQPLVVDCVDGQVDLSAQADIRGTATTYVWYLGQATLDADSGEYVGETLYEGTEYTVDGGITTFHSTFDEKVMCVMANELYPNLLLTTERLTIDKAGIEEVESEKCTVDSGIYDLAGRRVSKPAHGIYIINGRKIKL
ncbi:MAG: hypothetical protein NC301_07080 [Bacteroides sp.]|nr:hypothetical protein [Bacteroides sp.]MCM1379134.1 hypothetical protein [Bacteroides sp.]MCM1445328.1 hypothetical protein [Prevotella sp.]